jgi:hypothetical protein
MLIRLTPKHTTGHRQGGRIVLLSSPNGVVLSQSDKHQKSLSLIDLAVTLNCKCVSY